MNETPNPDDLDDDAQGSVPPAADERPAVADAARRIAAGDPVDWPLLESGAEDNEARDVLDALHGVESIASFHRHWHPPEGQPDARPSLPLAWGGLSIVREIGRGSFGRVYLARDARLDRDVALKILDPAAAGDSPHGAAVIEEGRHLARLRHPNVVSIFGADLVDGRVGLEMELIEGRTLAEIVRDEGPLGADEAALIGRDVCRALAAVHGAGLVHRDVKAQNVIRERGGRIVLMDFGSGRRTAPGDETDLAGTPLYLAPEVLAGSAPTPRSDLYSVGALLYFLTTGSFPVAARTLDGLRAAHRSGERTPLRDVRPDLPQPFVDLVERALAPGPDSRPESAGRFEAELSKVLGQIDRPGRPDVTARRWIATAIVAAVAAIVTVAWAWWQAPPASMRTERFVVPLDGHLTVGGGLGSAQFALSPDGSRLAYSTMGVQGRGATIWIRHMNEVVPRMVEHTGDAGRAFFSPDGQWIGFHQSAPTGGRMMKIAIAGGAPVFVADWPQQAGASWAADGAIVFSSRGDLWRVAESGGTPERLTTLDLARDGHAIRPQAIPGGHVVFTLRQRDGSASAVAVLARNGRITTLVPDATSGKFLPPGLLVYVAGNPPWIMAAPFDPHRLELTGSPVQVQALRSPVHWFDVSASGTLVYSLPDEPADGDEPMLVWVDRYTGREEPLTRALPLVPGRYFAQSLRVSPDARKVAYTTSPNALIETVDTPVPGLLWVGDLARGLAQLVTRGPVQPIAWSRDGTRITYRTREGAIVWRRVDGSGAEELLAVAAPDLDCTKGEWSPDGQILLVACGGTSGADPRRGFVALSFPTAEAVGKAPVQPEVFLSATPGQGGPRFSPDGRWITYSANLSGEQGAHAVYARAFPGPGATHRISPHGIPPVGGSAIWRGRELFFLTETGPRVVDIRETYPGLVFDPPRAAAGAFSAFDSLSTGGLTFDVSPDGRRFLVLKRGRGGDYVTRLTVALHWADEVTRKIDEAERAR